MRSSRALPRAVARVTAPLLIAGLALTGCGGGGGDDEPSNDSAPASSPTPEEPDTWPLTGVELPPGESATKNHPVMVVKMDNTQASAPQVGLSHADMVVEELVEGGYTRLAAFFYSDIPGTVGPVRSMRASDIDIVTPARAEIVTSGAAQWTIDQLNDADVTFYQEGESGFFRDDERNAPYNLFADLAKTTKQAKGEAARPDDYLPFGDPAAFPGGQPATSITADFGAHNTEWAFEAGKYINRNSYAAQGDEFTADTIVVCMVKTTNAPYKDPSGASVPISHFNGKGKAMVFHNGTVVRGTWVKDAPDAPVRFETKTGPLSIPAGKTWIELVPSGGAVQPGSVTFQ